MESPKAKPKSEQELLMKHKSFVTTTRGLGRSLPPMRLCERAKRLGIWNLSDIDLSSDKVAELLRAQKSIKIK